jgi:hypothetical protein
MNFLVNTYRRPHPKELRSGQSEQPWSNDSLKRRPDVRHARNRARNGAGTTSGRNLAGAPTSWDSAPPCDLLPVPLVGVVR